MNGRKNVFPRFLITAVSMCCTLTSGAAQAKAVAELANNAGGKMVITDELGECGAGSKMMYTYTRDGKLAFGCWVLRDRRVMVRYEDGETYTYPIGVFSTPPAETPLTTQSKPHTRKTM